MPATSSAGRSTKGSGVQIQNMYGTAQMRPRSLEVLIFFTLRDRQRNLKFLSFGAPLLLLAREKVTLSFTPVTFEFLTH